MARRDRNLYYAPPTYGAALEAMGTIFSEFRGRLFPIPRKGPAGRLFEPGKVEIIAHRAGAGEFPENSRTALKGMRDAGVIHIETDAQVTRDGVVILMHDPILDRTTDGSGLVGRSIWDDVLGLVDDSGERPLRFDEALADFPELVYSIDAKTRSVVVPLVRTIRLAGAQDRVHVTAFREGRLAFVRSLAPGIKTSLGMGALARLWLAGRTSGRLRRWLIRSVPGPKSGVEALQAPRTFRIFDVLTPGFVEVAHAKGIAVHAWTVNEPEVMEELFDMGVDGIITDEPTLAREVLERWQAKQKAGKKAE